MTGSHKQHFGVLQDMLLHPVAIRAPNIFISPIYHRSQALNFGHSNHIIHYLGRAHSGVSCFCLIDNYFAFLLRRCLKLPLTCRMSKCPSSRPSQSPAREISKHRAKTRAGKTNCRPGATARKST